MSQILQPGGRSGVVAPVLQSEYRGAAFRRPRSMLFSLTCGAVTGGLLWLCYFPVAWGWLAWIALVPLLALVRTRISGGRLALAPGSPDWRSIGRSCNGCA